MKRLLQLLLILVAALMLVASAAAETSLDPSPPVVVGHFDFTNEFPGDTSLCGFPVDWVVHSEGSFRYFPSEQGHGFTNVATGTVDYTFSANGKTVVVDVRREETFFPNKAYPQFETVLTAHGLWVKIRLLGGGLVIRDAGLVVELPDGTHSIVRGPHPVLEAGDLSAGVAIICSELAS